MTTVRLVQTGGVAGLKLVADLDDHEAAALADVIDAALAEGSPGAGQGAARDSLEYDITIDRGNHTHTLHGSDVTAGPKLRALADALRRRAEPAG